MHVETRRRANGSELSATMATVVIAVLLVQIGRSNQFIPADHSMIPAPPAAV